MDGYLALFSRTFIIGILVAAPVGAMGVLCIQRTLARGWRAGVATGMGIATADATYAALAAFGVAAISTVLVTWQVPLQLLGGAVLVYLGLASFLTQPAEKPANDPTDTNGSRAGSLYVSAVALTLTNPMTIMAFAAVFASAGLAAAPSARTAVISTLGVAAGSLSWWLALVSLVALASQGLSQQAVGWVTRMSGVLVAAFGLVAIVGALPLRGLGF